MDYLKFFGASFVFLVALYVGEYLKLPTAVAICLMLTVILNSPSPIRWKPGIILFVTLGVLWGLESGRIVALHLQSNNLSDQKKATYMLAAMLGYMLVLLMLNPICYLFESFFARVWERRRDLKQKKSKA
jgi:hypothetical protein